MKRFFSFFGSLLIGVLITTDVFAVYPNFTFIKSSSYLTPTESKSSMSYCFTATANSEESTLLRCTNPPAFNDVSVTKILIATDSPYNVYVALTYISNYEIDEIDWDVVGGGFTITVIPSDVPNENIYLSATSPGADALLRVRSHNPCGWSSWLTVGSITGQ
ncbi:MAG: hypothetical protein LBR18_04655 [Tannerella sp.]|jgi:hypothetical protein|nr:hypothetical protein [Tannerella sp.]